MVVNWYKVRKVVLNDRLLGYKPDLDSIKLLSKKLPDVNILGFGVYQIGIISSIWYLLAESRFFLEDGQPGFMPVGINSIPFMVPKKLLVAPNNFNGKPSA